MYSALIFYNVAKNSAFMYKFKTNNYSLTVPLVLGNLNYFLWKIATKLLYSVLNPSHVPL